MGKQNSEYEITSPSPSDDANYLEFKKEKENSAWSEDDFEEL